MDVFLHKLDDICMDSVCQNRIGSLLYRTDVNNLREAITKEMFNRLYANYNDRYYVNEKDAFVLVLLYKKHKTITLSDDEYDVALQKFNSDIEPMFVFYKKDMNDHSEIIYRMSYQKYRLFEKNTWKKNEAISAIQHILRFICGYYHYYDTARESRLGKDLLFACIMFYQCLIGCGKPNVQIHYECWRTRR
jgi:hypothetical protein